MLIDRFTDRPLALTDRFTDRLIIGLCSVLCILYSQSTFAWDYSSTENEDKHAVQLRMAASYSKRWKNGLGLQLAQDLRFDLASNITVETASATTSAFVGPRFNKSYTTLSLSYKHPQFEYLKGDIGYTLKLTNKDTLDIKEIMRHRAFVSLTGSYRYENWSFSLRERVLTEIRMDELDLHTATGYYEDNRANWYLRSKVEVAYHAMSQPLKPYLWCELENTLNANPLQQNYAANNTANTGHQYISRVRTGLGLVWRINRRNSLDCYYRFQYNYHRDVNVKPNKQTIHLTEERAFVHMISIAYHFADKD